MTPESSASVSSSASSAEQAERILAGLDENQACAAQVLSGPVRIIAGAGSGKTRTITRRIAYACASGAWNPDATLAVTYTNKAAAEMKLRLARMGVHDVHASTFHSAAYSQLRRAWRILSHFESPEIADPRDLALHAHAAMAHTLQLSDYTDSEVRDVLQELSWMKVNLLGYEDYERIVGSLGHELPLDLEPRQMLDVARAFETEKRRHNVIDFDDCLLLLAHLYENYEDLAEDFRQFMRHITIDEYQDVSPLQHLVLTRWLGKNRDICVVGDPAQTIYSYAGATSYYLLNFAEEFGPVSHDVQLNTDYRSSGNIVEYANAVLAGSPVASSAYITLTSPHDAGPRVHLAKFASDGEEMRGIASRILWHHARGTALRDVAILTRTRMRARDLARACREAGLAVNLRLDGENEVLRGAVSGSDGGVDVGAPSEEAGQDGAITISTIHAAKGLEWPLVFIPDCHEGNIPFSMEQMMTRSDEDEDIEEERRIFYVAVTRGIQQVYLCVAQYPFEGGRGVQRTVSRFVRQASNAVRRAHRGKS
ncbi:ATP-dependent helicase [Alloscardovia macacae]|uniref:ATP-dependent helicase n=1 Tax=Alloscardovia macacae TaxID=1160091 RepID=UPI00131414C0|nr:ATP-dependent helicase [Alloscardovia macacae]